MPPISLLDNLVPDGGTTLVLHGYNVGRSDHPNDGKRGDICVYCTENLSLKVLYPPYVYPCGVRDGIIRNYKDINLCYFNDFSGEFLPKLFFISCGYLRTHFF